MQDIFLSQNEIVGAKHDLLLFEIVANALDNVTSLKYTYLFGTKWRFLVHEVIID